MAKQNIKFRSSQIVSAGEDSTEIIDIAQKRGIQIPSTHLGFFKTVYAKIEEPNLNKIRLAKDAVYKALPGLIGSQVNFEHLGAGFLCGTILDSWINEVDEIEVVYSFYKSIYPDEYEQSIELAKKGKLAVSFELLSERESQEFLSDGTVRLNDIDFQGMGHLMMNPPACPQAKIYEFASQCKERLSQIEDRELVCALQIEEACNDILEQGAKWQTKYINTLPNSSFAVIEPAYLKGETDNKQARHLPFKDENGKIDLPHYRNALARVNQILPVTDSISTEELRNQAQKELDKHKDVLKAENNETKQGGQSTVTEEQKQKIAELRAELGDFAKEISDEDLLNEAVVAELRKEVEAKKAEVTSPAQEQTAFKEVVEINKTIETNDNGEQRTVVETTVVEQTIDWKAKAEELEVKVKELEASLKSKESEIETIRANSELIGKRKVELKDNAYVKEFSNEDYLSEEKINKAIQDQKNAEILISRKDALKDNDFAKDFSDEDYLNNDKVELAKIKKEKIELEAKIPQTKEVIVASETEKVVPMPTGTPDVTENSYDEVMASVRKESKEKRDAQRVYKRK